MSLQALAGNLQSAGRGDDSVLVHMTPSEVHGLQSLAMAHGGSLTINPQTGLPEAGFLSSILPMIAGFALAPLTAGTSLAFLGATPFASALTVGGLTALTSGSLKKGLMAGLGAYGGAGLGGSLAGAGQAAAVNEAAPAVSAGAEAVGTVGTPASAMVNASGEITKANLAQSLRGGIFPQEYISTLGPEQQAAIGQLQNASTIASQPVNTISNTFGGIKAIAANPTTTGLDFVKGNYKNIGMAAAPMLEGLMEQPTLTAPAGSPGMIRPYTYAANPTGADQQNTQTVYDSSKGLPSSAEKTYFQPKYVAQTPYAAPGKEYTGGPDQFTGGANAGIAGLMGGTSQQYTPEQIAAIQAQQQQGGMFNFMNRQPTVTAADGGLMGGPVEQMTNAIGVNTGYPMANLPTMAGSTGTAVYPFSGQQTFAGGGEISDLGSYSDGGRLLRGPGTGLSDNIPAQIGARQPARLADGEFVIPADVVSAMGGGSTDAGAKKFYAMLDRVRQQAHGSKKQVRKISDRAVMPA